MENELVKKSDIVTIDRKNIERLIEELEFLDSSILLKIDEHTQNVQQNQKIFDNQLKKTLKNIEDLQKLNEETKALHLKIINKADLDAKIEQLTNKIVDDFDKMATKETLEIFKVISDGYKNLKKNENYQNLMNFKEHSQLLRDCSDELVHQINQAKEVLLKVEKIRNRPTYFFLFGYGTGMITTLSIVYLLQKGIISF